MMGVGSRAHLVSLSLLRLNFETRIIKVPDSYLQRKYQGSSVNVYNKNIDPSLGLLAVS
jgi:hypothetical protein